ncbi:MULTISPECIES: ABC transporter ATP-binding protein [Exiguobacterium]|uniref:ABC transporter ATP-binding protein n=1 Tax=Exiguobacterium TaxID=33986 RepID=UPI001BEAA8BE|nr:MULTISPECIES: ATP-binding cassette domain-containing protein [Exiguobacterium]MCT4782116.1 ATP-binding cassette domain-containing protein [Exiguobacterium himgiriensis]
MSTVIELKNVTKSYKGNVLFDAVDLTISRGKIVGIVGPNGSGKSILFKMMCGFVFPDTGEVYVREQQIGKGSRFPEDFGIIIDRPGYIAGKTGFENLRELAHIQNKISDATIRETMSRLGLNPDNQQKVKNYSLGMKQKLAIAQAIMENQQILILDEAFNALDHDSVQSLRELLLTFRDEGKTILITSHNQEDIDYLCEDVYRINRGKLEKIV